MARSSKGLDILKDAILNITTGHTATFPRPVCYSPDIEMAVAVLTEELLPLAPQLSPRWFALRLLEQDESILQHFLTEDRISTSTPLRQLASATKKVAPWFS